MLHYISYISKFRSSALFQLILPYLIAIIVFGFYQIDSEKRSHEEELEKIASEIGGFFVEAADYTQNVLSFMGHQIRIEEKSKNYHYTLELFKAFSANDRMTQTLSWTLVSWVDTEDKLRVDAKLGILPEDEVKTVSGQPHLEAAKKEQWKIKLAKPQLGNTSGKWIIPSAVGVADNKGDYIGSLIFGFEIEKLKDQFKTYTLGKNVEFAVIDQAKNVVMRSSDTFEPDISNLPVATLLLQEKEALKAFNLLTDENYLVTRIPKYPYLIYLSYDTDVVFSKFWTLIYDNKSEIILTILILGFIVGFFYKRIIKPIVQLSNAASELARGNDNITIPRTSSHEMFALAKALVRTKSYKMRDKRAKQLLQETNQELQQKNETLNQYSRNLEEINAQLKQTKDELENALRVIHDSDREREGFLRDMHRSLHISISAIMNGALLLKQEKLGALNQHNYGMIFDAIYDAGKQLESLTTEFLNPTQVDVSEVLHKCVVLQRRYATEKDVSIKLINPKKLPIIWADRLRLRQIFLSTMYHSLLYIPENEQKQITITTKLEKNARQEPEWLQIEVKDDGSGVDEKSRQLLWNNHFKGANSYNRDPNMMNLDVKTLRHLVALHHGTFTIDVTSKKGTVFTIRLPYLSRDELEIPMELREAYDQKAHEYQNCINQAIENARNVVKFPEKKRSEAEEG